MGALIVLLLVWTACGCIGALCAANSGRAVAGFVLGVGLGPIGWACALFLPRHREQVLRVSMTRRHRHF